MEGFRGFGGESHPQNSTFFILPNSGNLEGEERGVVSLILKRFKLSILPLRCQFIFISIKLTNEGHNCQFI
jgi:hypothetical protein